MSSNNNRETQVLSVTQALHALYYQTDPTLRSQAQQWLIAFQLAPEAWEIAFILLSQNNLESQNFGASTLEQKIKREWNKVSSGQHQELQRGMLEQVIRLHNANQILLTRLSIGLSAIAVHMVPGLWPNFIEDLLRLPLPALLQVLKILPEEIQVADYETSERKYVLSEPFIYFPLPLPSLLPAPFTRLHFFYIHRRAVSTAIREGGAIGKILQILSSITQQQPQDDNIQKSALRAIQSWLHFDVSDDPNMLEILFGPLNDTQPPTLPLAAAMLSLLHSPNLNYVVAGSIASVLEDIFTVGGGRTLAQNPSKFAPLFDSVLSAFAPIYMKVVQLQLTEPSHAITQLLVRTGEYHTKLIFAQGKPFTEKLIEFIIACTSHPDREIASLTFTFWCEIHALHEEGEAMPKQLSQQLLLVVGVLCKQCTYPSDLSEAEVNGEDEVDVEFIEFRREAGDCIEYIYAVVGSSVLDILALGLADTDWRVREAALYGLAAVSEYLEDTEPELAAISKVIALSASIPFSPFPLGRSLIKFFGLYGKWFKNVNSSLGAVIQGFLPALDNMALAPSAASALKNIAEVPECTEYLATNNACPVMINAFAKATESAKQIYSVPLHQSQPPATYSTIASVRTPLAEVNARIILVTTNNRPELLHQLAGPIVENLRLLHTLQQNPAVTKYIVSELELLTSICKHFDLEFDVLSEVPSIPPSHPLVLLLQSIQPTIDQIYRAWSQVYEVVEAVSQFYKHAMLSTRSYFYIVLHPFLSLTVNEYKAQYNYTMLQALSVAVSIFGKWKSFENDLAQSFQMLCISSINTIQSDVASQPDIVKEFFSLCSQYARYASVALARTNLLPAVYQLSISILPLLPDKTVRYDLTFVETIVGLVSQRGTTADASAELVGQAEVMMSTHGSSLVRLCFAAVAGYFVRFDYSSAPPVTVSRSLVRPFSELLYALVESYPSQFRDWARSSLAQNGFPTAHVNEQQKVDFLNKLMRIKQKPDFKNTVHEFAVLARGLGEYGSRTNPL